MGFHDKINTKSESLHFNCVKWIQFFQNSIKMGERKYFNKKSCIDCLHACVLLHDPKYYFIVERN